MIKATLKERYISSENGIPHDRVKEIVHDVRIFSTQRKLDEWLQTFQDQLWQDDPTKVNLVEGIFVDTERIIVDNTTPPKKLRQYATFRRGVSYYYANDSEKEESTVA